jgi:hypothetical protein
VISRRLGRAHIPAVLHGLTFGELAVRADAEQDVLTALSALAPAR